RYESLTISIRVGHEYPQPEKRKFSGVAFRAPALGLIADSRFEQIGLGSALLAASILTISVVAGLKNRQIWRPESITQISHDVRLPFMSPDHFSTAPSVLQDSLDRFNYVDSVSNYYLDLTETLTSNEPQETTKYIFEPVKKQYSAAFSEQHGVLEQFRAASLKAQRESTTRGGQVLSIPMAQGESLNGSMQRVLDKVSLVSQSATELVNERAKVSAQFDAEPSYDFGDKGGTKPDALAEFTKKLGEGYRKVLPDEEQQIAEAKSFAVKTSAAQIALFGKEHLASGVNNCCDPLVGLNPGVLPIEYSNGHTLDGSDQKLAALKASIWGTPLDNKLSKRIIEPKSGVIDEKAVEKSIAQGRFQLQLCFELALRRNQSEQGLMEWQWNIDTKGQLSDLNLINTTMRDQELINCVRKRISSWKFPKPKGGSVVIKYPFEFSRDKG
ncbi:MAG: AgmX/PglI C-terminal domain-containing protein, partial [Proteobacteria bacterium]|nr:AgmX/PglI C-terminal domain-containing protein [Pseudomonadota bacterium]